MIRLLSLFLALLIASPALAQVDTVARGLAMAGLTQNAPTNSTPYVTNLNLANYGAFRKCISTARQTAGTQCPIAVIGDSTALGVDGTTSGGSYTNATPKSWPDQLALLGVAGLPAEADSWWGDGNSTYAGSSLAIINPKVTLGSGWVYSGGVVFSVGDYGYYNPTNSNPLTFAPANPIDTCVIYGYQRSGQGAYTYAFDANAQSGAVSLSATPTTLNPNTVTASARGIHTINVERSSGNASIGGIHCYDSTVSKVNIFNWGWAGATAQFYNVSSSTYSWQPMNVIGQSPFTGVSLYFIDFGVNEWINNVSIATFVSNYQAIITQAEAAGANVILVAPFPSNPAIVTQATQAPYQAAVVALAASNNLALINWQGRVGGSWTTAVANGDAGANAYHPTPVGYTNLAYGVAATLQALAGPAAPPSTVLTGTSALIGGGSLAAGACASGTVSVAGAATTMSVSVSPSGTTPGANYGWWGYVSAAGTVTVDVCAITAGTPTAETYNVRVYQ